MTTQNPHYSATYFSFQKRIGQFGARWQFHYFKDFIKSTDTVLEFGCGGGYLLDLINAHKKIGIEVNPVAIAQAKKKGLTIYQDARDMPAASTDVVISNSALEHVDEPLLELQKLHRALKKNGRIILNVPNEREWLWKPHDINQHLYTWSQMSLGNLFTRAGFEVISINYSYDRWPPIGYLQLHALVGDTIFRWICNIWGLFDCDIVQLKIVAKK